MEKYTIDKDINLLYVQAASFPSGVGGAFAQLKQVLPPGDKRKLFGISFPGGNGSIIYRAAAQEAYPGEAGEKGCETFLVKKGVFISEYLANWKMDESSIGKAFRQLLAYPGIDAKGYCLEIYENDTDVRCLVPLT